MRIYTYLHNTPADHCLAGIRNCTKLQGLIKSGYQGPVIKFPCQSHQFSSETGKISKKTITGSS
jgi:hypothetical protein